MATSSSSVNHRYISAEQKARFDQQGYLIVENLLNQQQVSHLIERCDRLFLTQFETGIYPDEWYGRPGLSQPNATRQMTGIWRCDRTLASITLSSAIAHLSASLMGWPSARYGTDTFWAKPPKAPQLYFHRNNTYVQSIDPSATMTCWVALSSATAQTGTLQIAPQSHQWAAPDNNISNNNISGNNISGNNISDNNIRFLHAPKEDYRIPLWQFSAAAGIAEPEIVPVELAPGSAIFFHGDLWHGSDRNFSDSQTRQSISMSALSGEAQYQPVRSGNGYIFDRYRTFDSLELHESFYPILWSETGYRTPFLHEYCDDADILTRA